MKTLALIALQVSVLFPAVHWYAVRTRYASEGRWELIALVAALVYVFTRAGKRPPFRNLVLPSILTAAWAVGSFFLPPLLATWLAWTAIASTVSVLFLGRALDLHLFSLVSLSLPVLPLFQYHLSYPLRTVVAQLSALLLRFGGVAVSREGACLAFNERLIWVDAPCSGLRMMWSALFLAACLAALHGLGAKRTLLAMACTLVTVISANVLRTTSLFYVEAEFFSAPAWLHPAAGLSIYLLTAVVLLFVVRPQKAESCVASQPS